MRKYKNVIILFVIIIVLIAIIVNMLPWLYFSYVSKWKYQVEEFDSFQNDFKLIADFTKDYFESRKTYAETKNTIYVGYETKSKNYTLWDYTLWDYTLSNNSKIDITENIQTSLNRIAENAFKRSLDSNFYKIVYYNDKISFEIDNGSYSLVHTYDDDKPNFDNVYMNKRISTKRIKNNWYHVSIIDK